MIESSLTNCHRIQSSLQNRRVVNLIIRTIILILISTSVQLFFETSLLFLLRNQIEPEPIENVPVQNNNEEQPLPPPGNPENQPQDAISQPPLGASRNLTSDIWPHFTRLYLNEILKAKCIYCMKVLVGKSTNGTSHLRTHRNCCVQKKIHDGSQRILGAN
ncbi:hypothetical protein LINGRAHAP2_LOCUS640 [Linum grandiflorum]